MENDQIWALVRRTQARRQVAGNAVWFTRKSDGARDCYAFPTSDQAKAFRANLESKGFEILNPTEAQALEWIAQHGQPKQSETVQ